MFSWLKRFWQKQDQQEETIEPFALDVIPDEKTISQEMVRVRVDTNAGKPDLSAVGVPTSLTDGSPMPAEKASKLHNLLSGDGKLAFAPGVEDQLAEAGVSKEDLRQILLASTKKALS